MFSFPYCIIWDNTRGLILHLAASRIILSCSTCQASLKLSPASWPIHPALYFLASDIWRVEALPSDLKFSFPLSSSNPCPWFKGKDIGYMIIPSLNSQFSVTFHFLLQKWLGALLEMALGLWPGLFTVLSGFTPSSFLYVPLDINKLAIPVVSPSIFNSVFILCISHLLSLLRMCFHSLKLLIYPVGHLPPNGARKETDNLLQAFFSRFIITFQWKNY